MEAASFAIVSAMLAVYAVLDGFDFGAGIVHRLVARTDEERRAVLAAIGPVWDGNEVWLIAAGGVLFMAFPAARGLFQPNLTPLGPRLRRVVGRRDLRGLPVPGAWPGPCGVPLLLCVPARCWWPQH